MGTRQNPTALSVQRDNSQPTQNPPNQPKCATSLLADSNIILADVAHVKSATHDHDSTYEDTLIAMIESGDENGDDMDYVVLDLDQIEETNISIESLKKNGLWRQRYSPLTVTMMFYISKYWNGLVVVMALRMAEFFSCDSPLKEWNLRKLKQSRCHIADADKHDAMTDPI
ncbi:hypothetical protein Cgig2_006883 [Carnegiea gigantea]|uniref:Uncharacterized protein n=1 Tax=Carnegiea gigantea TaxID=171969 RepID=A0A9Q1K2X4_9CARY|nr:hypothetical protein Cgig2_006883 [Carnegiea gigantea]